MRTRTVLGLLAGVLTAGAACAGGYPLDVQASKNQEGGWDVEVHNKGAAPILIKLELRNPVNARSVSASSSGQKVLEPGARETLMVVIPEDPAQEMKFEWESKWVFGRGTAKAEHDGIYRPPFPADLTFDTLNSAHGNHDPKREGNAVDIMMPEGTPVIAARSGYVTDVRGEIHGDKVTKGAYPAYETGDIAARMGNYIRILQDDGTYAIYYPLKDASVKVSSGDRIEAGTQIALSGALNGTAPFMHFAVMKPQSGFNEPISVPLKMEMAGRGIVTAKAGEAIGAAASVEPSADVVRRDPLVVASIRQNKPGDSESRSHSTVMGQGLTTQLTLGVVLATILLTALLGLLLRKRIGPHGFQLKWPGMMRLRKGTDPSRSNDESSNSPGELSEAYPLAMRPRRGFMFTDWEEQFYGCLSLSLQIGFSIHAKVALHRLLQRPIRAMDNPIAYAILRGESIDFVIVRERDGKIVAAVELIHDFQVMEDHRQARDTKLAMLKDAGINVVAFSQGDGPEAIREKLGQFMIPDPSSQPATV